MSNTIISKCTTYSKIWPSKHQKIKKERTHMHTSKLSIEGRAGRRNVLTATPMSTQCPCSHFFTLIFFINIKHNYIILICSYL